MTQNIRTGALQKNGLERYIFSLRLWVHQNITFSQNLLFSFIFLKNIHLFHPQYVSLVLIWKIFHRDLSVSKEVQNEKIKVEKRKKVEKIEIFM